MIEIGYTLHQTWPIFHEVPLERYPDGMPMVKGFTNSQYKLVDTMIVRAKTLEEFVVAMFMVDAMEERGVTVRHLILPHVPGGRQDRINPAGDVLFTLKSVAQMINDRFFDSVTVFDPHSNVTPALINKCKIVTAEEVIAAWGIFNDKYDGVIAPDAGAGKRAFDVAFYLGVPFIQAEKHRDVATGKLSGFACNGLEAGKHYLVVDDICDGGGTFIGLGEVIEEADATADLYVTHGVFSKGTKALADVFANVFTTNSTDFDKHNAHVFNVIDTFVSR